MPIRYKPNKALAGITPVQRTCRRQRHLWPEDGERGTFRTVSTLNRYGDGRPRHIEVVEICKRNCGTERRRTWVVNHATGRRQAVTSASYKYQDGYLLSKDLIEELGGAVNELLGYEQLMMEFPELMGASK